MLQPKDTDWLNGYKNKTHIYAVYNMLSSLPSILSLLHEKYIKRWSLHSIINFKA